MAVPDFQSLMLPLLRFAAARDEEVTQTETVEHLAEEFRLTEEDLSEILPSGNQSTFANRVGWACTYMKKAHLLEATRRGYYRITDRGRELLKRNPQSVNVRLLEQYTEFLEFKRLRGGQRRQRETSVGRVICK